MLGAAADRGLLRSLWRWVGSSREPLRLASALAVAGHIAPDAESRTAAVVAVVADTHAA